MITLEEKELFSNTVNGPLLDIIHKDEESLAQVKNHRNLTRLPKLKKYDAKLDLHGLTVEQAERLIKSYISECIMKKQIKRILVIHGKGSGVLRHEIRNFLTRNPKINRTEELPDRFGGSGVILAILF